MKLRSMKILIVDDNLLDAMVPYCLITSKGGNPVLCLGGRQALERLSCEKFDLILLDWRMPDISGLEFIRRINKNLSSSQNPLRIVFYTGEELLFEDIPMLSQSVNIVDIWSKSMRPLEFQGRLERLVQNAS